jgi:hypothetical protein
LATLTKEVADEGNPETVRMLGAVVFKNFIANRGSVRDIHLNIYHLGSKISGLLGKPRLDLQGEH